MANKKLSSTGYEIQPGETYVPYTAGETLTEFTLKAALSGIVLGDGERGEAADLYP